MPAIRRQFNYSSVTLTPALVKGKAFCGQAVPVYVGAELREVHFNGFIDIAELNPYDSCCIITNIVAFTPGHWILDRWYNYDKDDWLLGCKVRESASLVLHNERPIVCNRGEFDSLKETKTSGTVHQLFPKIA